MNLILKLDAAGRPRRWIDFERAAYYFSRNKVLWYMGENIVLRGGHNHAGVQSILELPSIIAVKGKVIADETRIPFTNKALFRRDRNLCAYCGERFTDSQLTIEHVVPWSRGGPTTFANTVSACSPCNSRKDCRTPEEAKMPLLYLPYEPNPYEGLILQGRNILADQMAFLMQGVPKNSRLLA